MATEKKSGALRRREGATSPRREGANRFANGRALVPRSHEGARQRLGELRRVIDTNRQRFRRNFRTKRRDFQEGGLEHNNGLRRKRDAWVPVQAQAVTSAFRARHGVPLATLYLFKMAVIKRTHRHS